MSDEKDVELHEHLVQATLRMNPNLAGGESAKEFIRQQTSKVQDAAASVRAERKPEAAPSDTKRLQAYFQTQRRAHREGMADIERKRKALEKEALKHRRAIATALVNYLSANARSPEELQAVLRENRVFLQEIAVSERQIMEAVGQRRRKKG